MPPNYQHSIILNVIFRYVEDNLLIFFGRYGWNHVAKGRKLSGSIIVVLFTKQVNAVERYQLPGIRPILLWKCVFRPQFRQLIGLNVA